MSQWFPGLSGSRYATREQVRKLLQVTAAEALTAALQQAVSEIEGADVVAHATDTSNPHGVTAAQAGADPIGTASGLVSVHSSAANPHPQYATGGTQDTHSGNTDNPHSVTATQVGLGNVDNTADLDKPISTLTQLALDDKAADAALSTLSEVVGDLEEVVDEIHAGVLTVQSLTGAGALSLLAMTHLLTTDGEEQAITLGDGVIGQLKLVVLAAAGAGDSAVLAPDTALGWVEATFDAAGQALTLAWTPAGWAITSNNGAAIT